MASVKLVLRKKINKDGTFPLAIRITKDRKSSFIHLGKHIKETDWDEVKQRVRKSHPNSGRLNGFLIKRISEANDKLLEMETQKNEGSAKTVKKKIRPTTGYSFFKQAEVYIDELIKNGKFNRMSADRPRIERFREFLKGEDISFPDITVALLLRFKTYLINTRTIKERTAINHLVVIRSVFSQAIKGKIVDEKYYPFGKEKVAIKFPDSS